MIDPDIFDNSWSKAKDYLEATIGIGVGLMVALVLIIFMYYYYLYYDFEYSARLSTNLTVASQGPQRIRNLAWLLSGYVYPNGDDEPKRRALAQDYLARLKNAYYKQNNLGFITSESPVTEDQRALIRKAVDQSGIPENEKAKEFLRLHDEFENQSSDPTSRFYKNGYFGDTDEERATAVNQFLAGAGGPVGQSVAAGQGVQLATQLGLAGFNNGQDGPTLGGTQRDLGLNQEDALALGQARERARRAGVEGQNLGANTQEGLRDFYVNAQAQGLNPDQYAEKLITDRQEAEQQAAEQQAAEQQAAEQQAAEQRAQQAAEQQAAEQRAADRQAQQAQRARERARTGVRGLTEDDITSLRDQLGVSRDEALNLYRQATRNNREQYYDPTTQEIISPPLTPREIQEGADYFNTTPEEFVNRNLEAKARGFKDAYFAKQADRRADAERQEAFIRARGVGRAAAAAAAVNRR